MIALTSRMKFGLIPFRSPLLREYSSFFACTGSSGKRFRAGYKPQANELADLFLFHWVLRCFTSPGARRTPMYSVHDNTAFPVLGYPIRKSSDQRLLATSPKLIAGCYVLHRHVLSSHPPCALLLYNHCKDESYYSDDLSV